LITNPHKVEQSHRNVLTVRFDDIKAGWEQYCLLSADRHHDNLLADWKLEAKHLTKAADRGAMVFDVGDLFCAMQGKWDKRSDQNQMRPEHRVNNYLDAIVDTAVEFYKPWAPLFKMVSRGNHETNVEKRHGTDLTRTFIDRLNKAGASCGYGYYGGWVRFMFKINGTKRTSRNMYYFHGAGGGGPVTRGTIQTNRQSVYLPDAHIVVNGHTHDSWTVDIARHRLSNKGRPYQDICRHARTPGYKRDFNDGAEGWQVERWGPPKPVGCVWLRFYAEGDGIKIDLTADVE